MNAKKLNSLILFVVAVVSVSAFADSNRSDIVAGNESYMAQQFDKANQLYDKALEKAPDDKIAMFNKAASEYKLQDYEKAAEIYKKLSADSNKKDFNAQCKYNLGNSLYQQALKLKDTEPQKAIDMLKSAISAWRQSLDIKPRKNNSDDNIDVASAKLKQLMELLKQQQQQKQDSDKNNDKNENEDKKDQQNKDDKDQNDQQKDDQQKQPDQQNQQDKQQKDDQQQQQDQLKDQEYKPLDTTAQEILEKEKQDRKKRQLLIRGRKDVEKDW